MATYLYICKIILIIPSAYAIGGAKMREHGARRVATSRAH